MHICIYVCCPRHAPKCVYLRYSVAMAHAPRLGAHICVMYEYILCMYIHAYIYMALIYVYTYILYMYNMYTYIYGL